jgi:valyl-tRNA synthetase
VFGVNDEYIAIATTRPETMFVDIAVFVNPTDERYKKYIGKFVINPINNEKIPVLADQYIDKNFGTGAMKCTPAHDFNDYDLAIKNKINKFKNVLNDDGTLNNLAKTPFRSFEGIDRIKARIDIVSDLEKVNSLLKKEEYVSNVGYSERTNEIVEPFLSLQ